MLKKRILCLVLVLCALLALTACQKKETFFARGCAFALAFAK